MFGTPRRSQRQQVTVPGGGGAGGGGGNTSTGMSNLTTSSLDDDDDEDVDDGGGVGVGGEDESNDNFVTTTTTATTTKSSSNTPSTTTNAAAAAAAAAVMMGRRGGGGGGRYGGAATSASTVTSARSSGGGSGSGGGGDRIFDHIPQDYMMYNSGGGGGVHGNNSSHHHHPRSTEPILHFLPKLADTHHQKQTSSGTNAANSIGLGADVITLKGLLKAAEDDIRLHRARVHAAQQILNNNNNNNQQNQNHHGESTTRLLRTYQHDNDIAVIDRRDRLRTNQQQVMELEMDANDIYHNYFTQHDAIHNDITTSSAIRGMTQAERAEYQLEKWQRVLELYVRVPPTKDQQSQSQQQSSSSSSTNNNNNNVLLDHQLRQQRSQIPASCTTVIKELNWQTLVDKLLEGIADDEDISVTLGKAANMCEQLVHQTKQVVRDTADNVYDSEGAYTIRLQAHHWFSRGCLQQVNNIENQFKASGRAALQIGHQLEHAELKRSQCESASILIRRWWIMENLAEQESLSKDPIDVDSEIRGITPITACKMDPLFTNPESSLEASKALKQLRAVVTARGSTVTVSGGSSGAAAVNTTNSAAAAATAGTTTMIRDEASARRFDLTADLIRRTSDALESRLLNNFSEVYTLGGIYDFSPKHSKPGSIDWRELRALAQSLLYFESGRSLHKRYVDMVVMTRFPELFHMKMDGDNHNNSNDNTDNEDGTNYSNTRDFSERSGHGDIMYNASGRGGGGGIDSKFDMDTTRSKLSNLFHRVSEVCTAEFELIAHVFGSGTATNENNNNSNNNNKGKKGLTSSSTSSTNRTDLLDGNEEMPLVVARALLQRVISDPTQGLQARINDLLASIDRTGDFDAGARKLDTFVVIHEKAASLFGLLRGAADRMIPDDVDGIEPDQLNSMKSSVESLKGFLTSQELSLSNTHRQSYINLELRLLHHDCCSGLDQAGCAMVKGLPVRPDVNMAEKGILEEYRAPSMPLHKGSLVRSGYTGILAGPLKQSVMRQPLIHATDSLARARLMFGTNKRSGETTSRVILSIYSQMCTFYGEGFLYPIVETIREMLPTNPPQQPPQLPFDEEATDGAPDLGVSPAFWVALERIHSAAKSFDRELWAESRNGSHRVWETLDECADTASLAFARDERTMFYTELERRGEAAILRALDTLSTHIQWVLVTGGESMLATGGTRIFNQLTGQSGGPYAIPAGSSLDTPNSPAVKSLTYCLRVQFVHVQAALTPQSLASFWTALSMRLYDILVARLLQYYYITTVGAVILSRDVEALRSVAMLAGTDHAHWDNLRELITLYMTPPDAIKGMLTGPEGEAAKGLFHKAGRDQCLVFLSRRNDYRYRTASGPKKSVWVTDMLNELSLSDPTDGIVNIGLFAAGRMS